MRYIKITIKSGVGPVLRSFSEVETFLTKKTDKDGNVTLICLNKDCGYKS